MTIPESLGDRGVKTCEGWFSLRWRKARVRTRSQSQGFYNLVTWRFPGDSVLKDPPANAGDAGSTPGWGDPLKKGMATHSSVLAQEIPWTEEPGGLQSMGLQKNWTRFSNSTTTSIVYAQ